MAWVAVTIQIDAAVLFGLRSAAVEDDVSLGQVVRAALDRDLRRRAQAKRAVRADERLVAPLRSLLADDIAFTATWTELEQRLAGK